MRQHDRPKRLSLSRQHHPDPDARVRELGGRGPEEFWDLVQRNIEARRVRLVFLADRVPRELLRIVEYLHEQMRPTEVLAVEVRRYSAGGRSAYVPRVLGRTVAGSDRRGGGAIRNYAETTDYEGVMARCREYGDGIVVGFLGGASGLGQASLEELRRRSYKWDRAEGGTGPKTAANWLPGGRFLAVCEGKG